MLLDAPVLSLLVNMSAMETVNSGHLSSDQRNNQEIEINFKDLKHHFMVGNTYSLLKRCILAVLVTIKDVLVPLLCMTIFYDSKATN